MFAYREELAHIRGILNGFVRNKFIDNAKLSEFDKVIRKTEEDQIKTLNLSNVPLSVQRVVFGAIRNINTSLKGMKERLRSASLRHENPTTAEIAVEFMDAMFDVANYLENFTTGSTDSQIELIDKFSRLLYRKAKSFGFCQDSRKQLEEAGVPESQIESFISHFDNNIAQELDIEEEARAPIEDSN